MVVVLEASFADSMLSPQDAEGIARLPARSYMLFIDDHSEGFRMVNGYQGGPANKGAIVGRIDKYVAEFRKGKLRVIHNTACDAEDSNSDGNLFRRLLEW